MNKFVIGAGIAAGVALLVLFKLLMAAQEEKGRLAGEVDEAAAINQRNQLVIVALQDANARAAAEREAEARRAAAAVRKLAESDKELEDQKREHEIELADIRLRLTPEERVCADERVPDAYFVWLREPADSNAGSGDH
jgi:hypothetical protein